MSVYEILKLLSIFLLILGAISGIALFFISVFGSEKVEKFTGHLWGLFIIGILGGIILLISLR